MKARAGAKARVAILISGSGSNMAALLDDMGGDPGHPGEAALVLSNRPDAAGLARARERGAPTAVVDHRDFGTREAFEDAVAKALDPHGPDVLCLAGFMRVLSGGFVARYPGRILNIHPSLLPRHRGLHTHRRALEGGDREHGCTVHVVTADLDDGPILDQARVPVLAGDTEAALAARVLEREHALYPAVLRRFLEGPEAPGPDWGFSRPGR